MDYLIIYKWLSSYVDKSQAPSIINTMIKIFVGLGSAGKDLTFW
jgi:hypothetical protein